MTFKQTIALFALFLPLIATSEAVDPQEYGPPQPELKHRSQFYGFLPGHMSLEESGWFAHTSSAVGPHGLGHATFFEELPESIAIRIGFPTEFQRSFLMFDKTVAVPGVNGTGRVIARVKRDGHRMGEVKMAVCGWDAFGVRVISHEIRDLYGDNIIPWDYTKDSGWHDWILTRNADGGTTFSIDGKPELTLTLTPKTEIGKRPPDTTSAYLTFGHQRIGIQRVTEISELHFLEPDEARPAAPSPVPLADGPYRVAFSDGKPRVEGQIVGGKLEGEFTRFHPNGTPWSRGRYANGKKEGVWEYRNDADRLLSKEAFAQGVWNGPLKIFSWMSDETMEAEYKNGAPSGPVRRENTPPKTQPSESR